MPTEIVSLQERYGPHVGGEWVEPRSGEWFSTISPRDEEPLSEVGSTEVGKAIQRRLVGTGKKLTLELGAFDGAETFGG